MQLTDRIVAALDLLDDAGGQDLQAAVLAIQAYRDYRFAYGVRVPRSPLVRLPNTLNRVEMIANEARGQIDALAALCRDRGHLSDATALYTLDLRNHEAVCLALPMIGQIPGDNAVGAYHALARLYAIMLAAERK